MPLDMSVTMFSVAFITIYMYGTCVCNMQNIKYFVQDNTELTNIYRRITNTVRTSCAADCAKDPWCLAFVYDEELHTCDFSSFTPDDIISGTKTKQGSRLYYQNIQALTAVKGIEAWLSSIYGGKTASLAIDGNFGSTYEVCSHTNKSFGNYLSVKLDKTSYLVHVDILFRSELPTSAIVRNSKITVLVAHSQSELDTDQATVCGHYDGPPVDPSLPARVKCAPNTCGQFVKFRQNIDEYLNICEVSFYSKM